MAVLQVLHIPDERLRIVAEPVKEVNAEIQRIVDDMFDTMYAEEGIGLAATQVDIHKRIIVIDVSENRDERLVLINPELLEKAAKQVLRKAVCLSLNSALWCHVPKKLKSAHWIVTAIRLSWKPTICWQFAFSMRWITWSVNCLSITSHL